MKKSTPDTINEKAAVTAVDSFAEWMAKHPDLAAATASDIAIYDRGDYEHGSTAEQLGYFKSAPSKVDPPILPITLNGHFPSRPHSHAVIPASAPEVSEPLPSPIKKFKQK
jgi:hypothetical protein